MASRSELEQAAKASVGQDHGREPKDRPNWMPPLEIVTVVFVAGGYFVGHHFGLEIEHDPHLQWGIMIGFLGAVLALLVARVPRD